MLYKLNVIIYSYFELCGIVLPLKIDIKNIKDDLYTKDNSENLSYIDEDHETILVDTTHRWFWNSRKMLELKKIIKEMYDNIDWEIVTEDDENIFNLLEICDFESFYDFFINYDIFSPKDLMTVSTHIWKMKIVVRSKFIKECILLFDTEKIYPKIALEEDSISKFMKQYEQYMNYEPTMIELQGGAEFPFEVWFPENINKAYLDWSWREHEIKKIYLSMKHRSENFRELVKAKAMESSRKETSKTRR